jgi:hypothetical protein
MTKIAFLISGHARNYIYTILSFKNHIFNKCQNADIFISFKENSRTYYSEKDICQQVIPEYLVHIKDDISDKTLLNYLFREKLKYFGYDNEDYIQNMMNEKHGSISEDIKSYVSNAVIDQYARVKNIFEIFENYKIKNNVNYDIVVRIRLDRLWWVSDFNIENFIYDLNKLYFSYINWDKSVNNNLPNWIQDFFFMGNQELMIYIVKDFFKNLYTSKEYLLKHELNNAPETQFGYYINSNNFLSNKIIASPINNFLCSLYIDRPLYLQGYFVGTRKDIYNAFNLYKLKLDLRARRKTSHML